MKKISFIIIFFFITKSVLGQIQNGKTVLTSSLSNFSVGASKSETSSNNNPTQSSSSNSFNINPDIMIGKIKNNSLLSYGINLNYSTTKQMNAGSWRAISVAPTLSYLKYYKISERAFLSPFGRLSIGYKHAKQDAYPNTSGQIQKGVISSLGFYPFSFTFQINTNTNFIFSISRISVEYDRTKSYFEPQLANGKTISSNFLISGTLNSIGFGIQKTLK